MPNDKGATLFSIDPLYKRFSVGMPIHLSERPFAEFLKAYSYFIKEVYFSPPLGSYYHTRGIGNAALLSSKFTTGRFFRLLKIVKQSGISNCLVLNTHGLDYDHAWYGLKSVICHADVDSITTFPRFAHIAQLLLPSASLSLTYNYGYSSARLLEPNIKLFDTIVIGNKLLRDMAEIRNLKKIGYKVKLLLNNGCTHGCNYCKDSSCAEMFTRALQAHYGNYNALYARQSLMPYELHLYYLHSELVDCFKISSRSSELSYLEKCLKSYIFNDNTIRGSSDYYLWCRLSHLNNSAVYRHYDLKEIMRLKKVLYINANSPSSMSSD